MTLTVEIAREEDGRRIALTDSIPGCHVYGKTRDEALERVEAVALHAIAERLEDGDVTPEDARSNAKDARLRPEDL